MINLQKFTNGFPRSAAQIALWAGAVTAVFSTSRQAPAKPVIAPEFINFGYVQNNRVLPYVQMETYTHIAPPFVNFTAGGNLQASSVNAFVNRDPRLKEGGAAERAGTKVILCVRNLDFNEPLLEAVMTDPAARANLVNNVKNLVLNDPYCAGVNYDFEFRWSSAARAGITEVIQATRAALPDKEVSFYAHATFNSNLWDIAALADHVDYMLYSTYDWGSGNRVRAIADYDNLLPEVKKYMDAGMPPEKIVLTWASYGRRWSSTTLPGLGYGDTGTGKQSQGFYDTLYNTKLRQQHGGPFPATYIRGDETVTYSYQQPNPGNPSEPIHIAAVGESPESLELKISAGQTFPGVYGQWGGVRLRGAAWWSMMWSSPYWTNFNLDSPGSSFSGYDPVSSEVVPRAPYYRHIDLLTQEILKAPGQTQFLLESFENANPHWADPNNSPDTKGDAFNGPSTFTYATAPAGPGRPDDTTLAGRLFFNFVNSTGNQLFLRYEMLNSAREPAVVETPAALALVNKNTRITGHYYVSGNYSSRVLRLAAVDGLRQVEVSKPIPLPAAPGWYTFSWDLNDPAQIDPWTTAEPNLISGNGVIDSASPGERDVSFLGFIIEGGGAGNGTIFFDELKYEARSPAGKSYVINEFRYGNAADEFVEIAGPPGPVPPGLNLITYRSSDGSVYSTTSLAGKTIPANGLLVIGDTDVPGASGSSGFVPPAWRSNKLDLPSGEASGLQLYDVETGFAYDNVVYQAFGGVNELARADTRGVSREGFGWMGSIGNGKDAANQRYSLGRMPDARDTNWNQADFSFMPATPGQPNGAAGLIDTEHPWDFEFVPPGAFQTFRQFTVLDPLGAGIPRSPSGGKACRTVDPTGGGVIGVFGDAEQGQDRGLDVSGELFIPANADPAQAVAVGFCGTMGSTFFHPAPEASGYENGYWLIYENKPVNLANGQPNHPGSFQFVMASHDNRDSRPTTALGTLKPLASVGATAGSWVTFRLRVDPTAAAGEQLLAQINGTDIYRGVIPDGGRQRGAFMTGFREISGGIGAREGTWIDNLKIDYATPPARVQDYELY